MVASFISISPCPRSADDRLGCETALVALLRERSGLADAMSKVRCSMAAEADSSDWSCEEHGAFGCSPPCWLAKLASMCFERIEVMDSGSL